MIACLLSVINIRTTDGVVFDIMTLCETPSVLMNLLRSWCVVVLVKFLNALAHAVNMVRGKPSSRLDRGVGIPFTLS